MMRCRQAVRCLLSTVRDSQREWRDIWWWPFRSVLTQARPDRRVPASISGCLEVVCVDVHSCSALREAAQLLRLRRLWKRRACPGTCQVYDRETVHEQSTMNPWSHVFTLYFKTESTSPRSLSLPFATSSPIFS